MLWQTSSFAITCGESGTVWSVDVSLPNRIGRLADPTVIVCFDAPWTWGTVRDAVRVMSFAREVPEAVVVGLTFAAESDREYSKLRGRWFTPTAYIPPPEVGVHAEQASDCGHGDVTLRMVSDQLLPELTARYGRGERWFVGHSFSALLGLQGLFAQRKLFDRWLLASPSIWWDGRSILHEEAEWAAGNADLVADLWMSAGANETADIGDDFAMVANARDLAETLRLRGYPGLRVTFAELPNESHSSTLGAAVSSGLRALHRNGR